MVINHVLKGNSPHKLPPIFIRYLQSTRHFWTNLKNRIKKYWFLAKLWTFENRIFWSSQKTTAYKKKNFSRSVTSSGAILPKEGIFVEYTYLMKKTSN